jgi:hypothetical protein
MRCTGACPMRSGLLIQLLLGSLGGCALYFDDDGTSVDPGDDPGPGPGPDPVPPSPPTLAQQARALLDEWSGCMSLENFASADMAPTWSQLSSAGGKCANCHTEGTLDFPVSSDASVFFEVISEHKWPLLMFFGVDLTNRPGKIVINPISFQAAGSGTVPHAQHPRFSIEGAPLTALTTFYNLTVARKVAGECDPPRLID